MQNNYNCDIKRVKANFILCVRLNVLLQVKEDPDKWEELKRAEAEYEKRRFTLSTYCEAVRHAQQVQVGLKVFLENQLLCKY